MEHELGDLLFSVVNLARFLRLDPEQALRKANGRFRQRFGYVEKRVKESGKELNATSLGEMEEHWQAAKRQEQKL